MSSPHEDIRIGTLVKADGRNPADYIEQILPYGFESFCSHTHSGTAQLGGPIQVAPGQLNHSVGRPIAERRGRGHHRCVRVGHVEIRLHHLTTRRELGRETLQEIRRDPVVGV